MRRSAPLLPFSSPNVSTGLDAKELIQLGVVLKATGSPEVIIMNSAAAVHASLPMVQSGKFH